MRKMKQFQTRFSWSFESFFVSHRCKSAYGTDERLFFYFSLSVHKTIQSRCICIALTVPLDSFSSAQVQGVRENLFTRQFPHNLLHSLAIFGITKCRKTNRSRSQFTVYTSKWFPFFFYLFHGSVHEFV